MESMLARWHAGISLIRKSEESRCCDLHQMKDLVAKRLLVCNGSSSHGNLHLERKENMTIQVPFNETPFAKHAVPLNEPLLTTVDTVERNTFYRWMKHVLEPDYRRLKHILAPQVIDFASDFVAVICLYNFLTTGSGCH
jgi:hypothetical protein